MGRHFFDDRELGAVGLPCEFVGSAFMEAAEVAFFVPDPFELFGDEGAGIDFEDGDFEEVFGFYEDDGAQVLVEFADAVDALVPNGENFVADLLGLDFFDVGNAEGEVEGVAAGNEPNFFGFRRGTGFDGFGAPGTLLEDDVVEANDRGFPSGAYEARENFFPISALQARGAADHQEVDEFFAQALREAGRESVKPIQRFVFFDRPQSRPWFFHRF